MYMPLQRISSINALFYNLTVYRAYFCTLSKCALYHSYWQNEVKIIFFVARSDNTRVNRSVEVYFDKLVVNNTHAVKQISWVEGNCHIFANKIYCNDFMKICTVVTVRNKVESVFFYVKFNKVVFFTTRKDSRSVKTWFKLLFVDDNVCVKIVWDNLFVIDKISVEQTSHNATVTKIYHQKVVFYFNLNDIFVVIKKFVEFWKTAGRNDNLNFFVNFVFEWFFYQSKTITVKCNWTYCKIFCLKKTTFESWTCIVVWNRKDCFRNILFLKDMVFEDD